MKYIVLLFFVFTNFGFNTALAKQAIDLSNPEEMVNGQHVLLFEESADVLNLSDALRTHQQDKFYSADKQSLSFGIGSQPVWLQFDVINPNATPLMRRLSIKTSWLDHVSIYILNKQQLLSQAQMGDTRPFDQRSITSRYFEHDHTYSPGITSLFIRIQTPDPMLLPIYIHDIESAHADSIFETYIYAFIYGILFALSIYNLILYFTLRSIRYLFYTLYLVSFLIVNLSYTGHAYQWLWSNSPSWQAWSNPLLMVLFASCGLLFATTFLRTKQTLPRLHKAVLIGSIFTVSALLLSVIFNSPVNALLIAFVSVFVFSSTMILMGSISLLSGNHSAKFFLIASVTHALSAMITAMTVWGIMPYTKLGFHAVEIGMAIDALLLSIALSDQLRINNHAKLTAERLAMIDHLTGINNRRAFYNLVNPIWDTALRNNRDMSILIMDIDKFKKINDRYGHIQGDEVLKKLGNMLIENARSGDIAARWGGEEFIIFLPETKLNDACDIAERLCKMISSFQIKTKTNVLQVTVSIGVTSNNKNDITIDDLIEVADTYLYKAKASGRNQVCSPHKLKDTELVL